MPNRKATKKKTTTEAVSLCSSQPPCASVPQEAVLLLSLAGTPQANGYYREMQAAAVGEEDHFGSGGGFSVTYCLHTTLKQKRIV
eukprot:SAG31_NODE_19820_length_591_cov_0.733740_1_plen_85_part_00